MSKLNPRFSSEGRDLVKKKEKLPPGLPLSFSPQGELLACYGPQPEVWKATGYGTVFTARRVGKKEILFGALLSLSEGGITRLFTKPNAAPGSWRDVSAYLLERLNAFPPMVALPPDLVSEYLYGAYAFSKGSPLELFGYLNILKPPPGNADDWRRRLVGPGGLTPGGLVRVILENPRPEDMPKGKEVIIITRIKVALGAGNGPKVAKRLLRRRIPPLFESMGQRGEEMVLEWVRPYPAELPKSPAGHKLTALFASQNMESITLRTFVGNRQGMGEIAFTDEQAQIEAMTLSRASVLLAVLLAATEDLKPTVTSTTWESLRKLIGETWRWAEDYQNF